MLLVWEHTFEHQKPRRLEVSLFSPKHRNIKYSRLFRLHVFADLQPYICTFTGCEDELLQFSNRAAWADHEFSKHRIDQFWDCPECSNKSSSAVDWEEHLLTIHQRTCSRPKLQILKQTAYKPQSRPVESEECPLCRVVLGRSRRAFVKHVGRHMEEIALVALPRDNLEDSDEESVSADREPSLHSNRPLSPASAVDEKISGDMKSQRQQASTSVEANAPRYPGRGGWVCHYCHNISSFVLCPERCGFCPHHRCGSCTLC